MTSPRSRTALSVNLNKVALVRNTRHLGIPSVTRAAALCLEAGAQGITVHPRPDARHIRADDVRELHKLLQFWTGREFNIEGNPFHNLMDFVRELRPQQCTFVPDSEGQFTSDHGWNFPADADRLRPLIAGAKSLGVRVSLFLDPEEEPIRWAAATGADRVELYTEPFARAYEQGALAGKTSFAVYADAAALAASLGLGVNAGHDLDLDNLTLFRALPHLDEVSIGHALISHALFVGLDQAVRDYLEVLRSPEA